MTELTIGMAVYNDFDGVYFTVQDLRLHHDMENVEIVIVDNFGCDTTESFAASAGGNGAIRYIRYLEKGGTAAPRQKIFDEARGNAVLCLDSHVLMAPGTIARLKQFYRDNPATRDLHQGPIVWDCLQTTSTHFDPIWDSYMYGKWGSDPRGQGEEPFEIAMQGLGAFSCRREAWLGFNPRFRGFGGEEFYIHEKFRQAGHKCLCLPWLRWLHRFGRPNGAPYSVRVDDRIWNYLVGWNELNLPLDSIYEHFLETVPAGVVAKVASAALWKSIKISIKEDESADELILPFPARAAA